jgi:hypothetical protein
VLEQDYLIQEITVWFRQIYELVPSKVQMFQIFDNVSVLCRFSSGKSSGHKSEFFYRVKCLLCFGSEALWQTEKRAGKENFGGKIPQQPAKS